jgi:hypothetical protein
MYPTLPAIPAIPDQRSQASVCRSNAISYLLAQKCRETVAILESRSPVSVDLHVNRCLLERRRRRERGDRFWGTQQIGEDDGSVELARLNRAEDAGEHFVSVGAARGSVATTDFASDDGGAQGLFSAPVGRVDRRVEQKREDRGVFDREMRGEGWVTRRPPG